MKKNYLITGGHGFLGLNLCKFLKQTEPQSKIIQLPKNIDLLNLNQTFFFFKKINIKIDYIFHLADISGNKKWSLKNSFEQTYSNVQIHLNTIMAWKNFLPKSKFIFLSSVWAYPLGSGPQKESNYWNGQLIDYAKFYAYSKRIASLLLEAAKKDFKLKATTLVLGTVFGPSDKSDHFIPSIIRRMIKKPKELKIFGTGKESRDFIFVEDQVKAIYLHKDSKEDILNIGTGNLTSINNIIKNLKKILNFKGKVTFEKTKNKSEDMKRGMSVEKAISISGWPIQYKLTNINKALELTINDIMKNG